MFYHQCIIITQKHLSFLSFSFCMIYLLYFNSYAIHNEQVAKESIKYNAQQFVQSMIQVYKDENGAIVCDRIFLMKPTRSIRMLPFMNKWIIQNQCIIINKVIQNRYRLQQLGFLPQKNIHSLLSSFHSTIPSLLKTTLFQYQQIEELLHSIPSTIYGLPPPIFSNDSNELFSSFSHDYIDLLRYIMLTIQFSLPCSISISSFFHLGYDFVVHCFQHILVLSLYLDSIFYLLYHYLYIITEYHHLQLSPVMSSIQSILLSPSFIQVFLMIYALSIGDETI